ncbi:MAG: hypothetical protein MZV64_59885 [Ignavibacteriales bacterium]|nr:hypothetical protein [Ignavibacteriales bacterium]
MGARRRGLHQGWRPAHCPCGGAWRCAHHTQHPHPHPDAHAKLGGVAGTVLRRMTTRSMDRLALFPVSTKIENDSLTIAGHDLASLADRHLTPLYMYDRATLDLSAKAYTDALSAHYPRLSPRHLRWESLPVQSHRYMDANARFPRGLHRAGRDRHRSRSRRSARTYPCTWGK